MVETTFELEPVERCPVCGGEGQFAIAAPDREMAPAIMIYECKSCKSCYQNPRMSQNSMIEFYSSGRYRADPGRTISEERSLTRIEVIVSMIDAALHATPKRCLDVGCSRGYLSRALAEKYGAEAVGIDVFKDPAAVIEVVGSKDQIAGKFDLITCIHVLEHFHDPVKELVWMAGLLESNGLLVIEIPTARLIEAPHPVIFSREVIPHLMDHIHFEYVFYDMHAVGLGIIIAWRKGPEDGSAA